jgi:hypothetical protein
VDFKSLKGNSFQKWVVGCFDLKYRGGIKPPRRFIPQSRDRQKRRAIFTKAARYPKKTTVIRQLGGIASCINLLAMVKNQWMFKCRLD